MSVWDLFLLLKKEIKNDEKLKPVQFHFFNASLFEEEYGSSFFRFVTTPKLPDSKISE